MYNVYTYIEVMLLSFIEFVPNKHAAPILSNNNRKKVTYFYWNIFIDNVNYKPLTKMKKIDIRSYPDENPRAKLVGETGKG